jgi:hypothetical protein
MVSFRFGREKFLIQNFKSLKEIRVFRSWERGDFSWSKCSGC